MVSLAEMSFSLSGRKRAQMEFPRNTPMSPYRSGSVSPGERTQSATPPEKQIRSARLILKTLNLRKGGIEIVSCPTCGRTQVDLISLAEQAEKLASRYDYDIKVAVMGCVVNGPGEGREADLGICGGVGYGLLMKHGEILKKLPESELIPALKEELDNWEPGQGR